MLYEMLRSEGEGPGTLSMEGLVSSLGLEPEGPNRLGEIMAGMLFACTIAAERSASPQTATLITAGARAEFMTHLLEQGADPVQRAEWDAVLAERMLSYRRILEATTGFEPPWKLGRAFYWNLSGQERYDALAVKVATLYLMEARDAAQRLLNEHGPRLRRP